MVDAQKEAADAEDEASKKELYNRMTGNIPELFDPANSFGNFNTYPNTSYTTNTAGAEPSIRGRQLYIPINTWFTLDSALALPLLCLEYNELNINITFRPIKINKSIKKGLKKADDKLKKNFINTKMYTTSKTHQQDRMK